MAVGTTVAMAGCCWVWLVSTLVTCVVGQANGQSLRLRRLERDA